MKIILKTLLPALIVGLLFAFGMNPKVTKYKIIQEPTCGATYAGVQDGKMMKMMLEMINRLDINNCDLENMEIVGFEFECVLREDTIRITNDAATFGSKIRDYISLMKVGQKFRFNDIVGMTPDSSGYDLGFVSIEVI